jgi:ribosomal 30S subunit maturation factor RimM
VGYEVILNDKVVGEVTDYFLQGSTWSLIVKLEDGRTSNIPMVEDFVDEIKEGKVFIKDAGLF